MDAPVESIIRNFHIIVGAISLLSGVAALLASPTTKVHKPLGKIFFFAMIGVFISAIVLAVQNGIDFLFCIAILSFFSVLIGVRSLRFMKGSKPTLLDWASVIALISAGFYLVIIGISGALANFNGGIVLYMLFGTAMIIYGTVTGSQLIKNKPRSPKWFILHKSNMGAALIATLTAFSTTSLDFLPSIIPWIWPSIIFSPLLSWYIRKTTLNVATR